MIPSDLKTEAYLSSTVYADDVCIWSTARSLQPVLCTLTTTIQQLPDNLADAGLAIAAEKSRLLHFKGRAQRHAPVCLTIHGKCIVRAQSHRFLGVMVDADMRSTTQVKAILDVSKGATTAIRRLASSRRGGSPSALLQLHQAMMVNRIVYSLPFTRPPSYLCLKLERVHRAGIKLALGVPMSTSTSEIYAEVSSVPIADIAHERAIFQLLRLHMSKPGRRILHRISKKPGTLATERLAVLHELTEGENLSEELQLAWPETPPWRGVELPITTEIPKVQRKVHQNTIVMR